MKTFLSFCIIYRPTWKISTVFDVQFCSIASHYQSEFARFTFSSLLYSSIWLFTSNWVICSSWTYFSYELSWSSRTSTYFASQFTCTWFKAFGSFWGFTRKAFGMWGSDCDRIVTRTLTWIWRLGRFLVCGFAFCEKFPVFKACSWKGALINGVVFLHSLLFLLGKK